MDEVLKASPPESPAAESRRWIGRFLIAVVLGEAIWGFLVSITTNLAQPAMSRVLGADPQSPLYLGRGDINVPALFTAVVELCFAGIVAVLLNASTQRPARTRTVVVRQGPVAVPRPAASPVPSSAPLSISAPVPTPASAASPPVAAPADPPAPAAIAPIPAMPPEPTVQPAPPQEKRSPQSVAPTPPKKPKKVYYNIVGEAIESDDE